VANVAISALSAAVNWRKLGEITVLYVVVYFEAVEIEDPESAPTLASALTSVARSSSAPTFKRDTFYDLVSDALAPLDDEDKPQDYSRHNPHLLDSLLSGLSLKHGFRITSDMSWSIVHGLKVSAASRWSKNLEVFVRTSFDSILDDEQMKDSLLEKNWSPSLRDAAHNTVSESKRVRLTLRFQFLQFNVSPGSESNSLYEPTKTRSFPTSSTPCWYVSSA